MISSSSMATCFILGLSTPLNTTSDPELLGQLLCPRPKKEVGNDNRGRRKRVGFEPLPNGVVCLPNGFAISGADCMGTFWGFSGMEGWSDKDEDEDANHKRTTSDLETLIQTRCKSGTLNSEEALGYFNSMIQTKSIPSNWTFKCLFGALSKMKQYSAVVSMYKQLIGCRQFQPDVSTMNIFMNCLCRLNRVDLGFSVLALTFKYGLEPDAYSLNALLQGLCKNSALSEAVELFWKIEEKGYPDVVTYNTLIYGLCQSGKWEKAKSFLICMVDSGIPPDVYTYGVLISALCREERIHEALALFEDMTGKGINPNVFIFNSLISASCKCYKWEEAAQLFQNMIDCGSLPDIVTFNAVLDALCKEGKTVEALNLVEEMTRRGQMPNLVTYNSLINGLCLSGRWREATKLLNKMMGEGIPPGVVTLNIVIKYLCKDRRTNEAFTVLELMTERGLKPNVVTYNC
ncbi:unnamed protein product [Prunus brigantina]